MLPFMGVVDYQPPVLPSLTDSSPWDQDEAYYLNKGKFGSFEHNEPSP
jgi:hypothetical protein